MRLLLFLLLPTLAFAAKPNVLFIAVDDLRPELNCFGASHILSPNLDRLAESGTAFLHAHCQQVVCSPSRSSLLTGLRPDTTKVYDLDTHFRKAVPDVVTLPQHFRENGYRTLSMGKIYHNGFDDAPSWSEPALKTGGARYVLPENLKLIAARTRAARERGLRNKALSRAVRGPATECAEVPDEAYTDGAVTKLAIDTLGRLKEDNKPFFLAVGYANPHLPFNSPKKYWDLYDPATIKLASNPFKPKNAPSQALTDYGELRGYEGIPAKGPIPDDKARELRHGYYAAVSFVDACVGRLLDELDRLGLADNTIVVLWGDHGWKLGEHASWCKHSNVYLDTNAALLVRAPGQQVHGTPSRALVEFVDLYPTLCDLARLPKPGHLQGDSFAPLLDDPRLPWKRAAFSQYPRGNFMGYSLNTASHRYTVWLDREKNGKIVATELYDHGKDPAENRNVAADPAFAPLLKELETLRTEGWQGTRAALSRP